MHRAFLGLLPALSLLAALAAPALAPSAAVHAADAGAIRGERHPAVAAAAVRGGGGAGRRLTLDVLTFNTLLLPAVVLDGQGWRAPLMAERLAGYDLVLLQEAYSDPHRRTLLRGLADAYPHCTRVLGRDRWFRLSQDGGVVICSRWPIEREVQRPFGAVCAGSDCLADKGVLYARINKGGRRAHVFATHLQSGRAGRHTRDRQIAVIRELIDELALPAHEPVLIGGDFNIDRLSADSAGAGDGAFAAMTRALDAVHPPPPGGGRHRRATYDPARNPLARGAGTGRYVDYVLYSAAHRQPTAAFNAVRPIAAGDGRPLSDHFAVHGRFVFDLDPPPQATADPSPLVVTPGAGAGVTDAPPS